MKKCLIAFAILIGFVSAACDSGVGGTPGSDDAPASMAPTSPNPSIGPSPLAEESPDPGVSPSPSPEPSPEPSPSVDPSPAASITPAPSIAPGSRIIDHRCTSLTAIPPDWIRTARDSLHILYGHTSHGRQLTAGMRGLDEFMRGMGLYAMSQDGEDGMLDLRDEESEIDEANDLGSPDRVAWERDTRQYLGNHSEINVVIWSWCGQVSYSTTEEIDLYLSLMSGLEEDFPNVAFVYMTGHLDGYGTESTLHANNERIRAYCVANGKWLFDFADIESWDPDGNCYLDYHPTDAGNWDADGDGNTEQEYDETGPIPYCHPADGDRNWAEEWQEAHPDSWYPAMDRWNNGYHAPPLIANLKGYASWWLWARISGWNED